MCIFKYVCMYDMYMYMYIYIYIYICKCQCHVCLTCLLINSSKSKACDPKKSRASDREQLVGSMTVVILLNKPRREIHMDIGGCTHLAKSWGYTTCIHCDILCIMYVC